MFVFLVLKDVKIGRLLVRWMLVLLKIGGLGLMRNIILKAKRGIGRYL